MKNKEGTNVALYLREAVIEDMELLYQWANDLEVRKNAFHTKSIPFDTHKRWFENVLENVDILQYILVETCVEEDHIQSKEKEIGQIRFSLEGERAVISYSIAKESRGQGYGVKMVSLAEEKLRETRMEISMCVALVKYENPVSAKVFEKCGYTVNKKQDYLEYTKKIR